jgi:Family of unknown function (DUF6491)
MKALRQFSVIASLAILASTSSALAEDAAKPATTATPKRSGNDCVFFNLVDNWQQLDTNTLIVWAPGRHNAYLLKLNIPMTNLSPVAIAFVDRNRDGMLCGYGMDEVISREPGFAQRATIMSMTKLDTAALAALEDQYKVKLLPRPKAKDKEKTETTTAEKQPA